MSSETGSVGARIDADLDNGAQQLVNAYFAAGSRFTGDLFDTLGQNEQYAVTRDDLLAVTLLDVGFSPRAVRHLFNEEVAAEISEQLLLIDPATPIWEATDAVLKPAVQLWRIIRDSKARRGIGPTITGKLLARKRPHLIPIIDGVVERRLGIRATDEDSWALIRGAMQDPDRRARVAALQPPDTSKVSVLRLLDVMIWMHGSQGRSAKAARETAGVKP